METTTIMQSSSTSQSARLDPRVPVVHKVRRVLVVPKVCKVRRARQVRQAQRVRMAR